MTAELAPVRYGPVPGPVDDLVAEFVAHLARRGLRTASLQMRRYQLGWLLEFLRPDTASDEHPLIAATPDQLKAYVDSIGRHGVEHRYAQLSAIRGFYQWAVLEGLVAQDPTLRLALPRRARRLPRPMPDEDVARVLDETTEAPLRQWVHLAAFAGLRAGEIAMLRRDDIVDPRVSPRLVVAEGKGGRMRVVPIGLELVELLDDHELSPTGWLFRHGTEPARHVTAAQVSKRANTWLHELGVAHSLHTLRHFYGTMLYTRTRNLRLVQDRMGHASPMTTAIYTQVLADEGAEEIRDLPNWWRERSATQ